MEILFTQVEPFIWFFGITTIIIFLASKFTETIKEKFKQGGISKRNNAKEPDLDQQFDSLIHNAPKLYEEVTTEISKQKEEGVTDEQMKSLISKQSMLRFAVDNKEIINMIGKPLVSRLLKVIKGVV